MKCVHKIILFIILISGFASCSDNNKINLKKNVTGKAGELVVVIPKELWEDTVGGIIRKHLTQEQVSLPQAEPIFNVVNVPPEAFVNIFQTNRSIIQVIISPSVDSSKVTFLQDQWAAPQNIVNIYAKDKTNFVELFNKNANKIIAFMLKGEKDRLIGSYANFNETQISKDVKQQFGVDIKLPPGFKKATSKDNFYWARYDTPTITQSVMIYSFPYESDSTFTSGYLIAKRDTLMKKYVEGPSDGSYMITETVIPPVINITKLNNNYTAELRGLWRMQGDYMGGPFISIATLSPDKTRIVVADAWVFAPKNDKRNYVRQLEAMIYSLTFVADKE